MTIISGSLFVESSSTVSRETVDRQHSFLQRVVLSFLVVVALMVPVDLTVAADKPEKSNVPTVEQIEVQIKRLDENKDLDETVRQKALDLYEKAKKEIQLSERWKAKKQAFDTTAKDAEKTIAEVDRQLELLSVAPDDSVPLDKTLSQLEQMLDEAELQVKQFEKELADAKNVLRDRKRRRAELPALIRTAKQNLAEIEFQLESNASTKEPELIRKSRNELLRAAETTLRRKANAYESEIVAHDATTPLIPLERDLAAAKLRAAEKHVKLLREAVRTQRRLEIRRQMEQAQRDLSEALPAVHDLAERSTEISSERQVLNEKIEDVVDASIQAEKDLARVTQQYARISEQIDVVGPRIVGDLSKRRANLPIIKDLPRRLAHYDDEIATTRFKLQELDEELEALGDMDQLVQDTLKGVETSDPEQVQQYQSLIRYLGGTKRRYLEQLIQEYEDYYAELIDLRAAERELLGKTEAVDRLIDERILSVRTTLPPNFDTVRYVGEALAWLVNLRIWQEVASSLNAGYMNEPFIWLIILCVFISLLFFRTQMRRAVDRIGDYAAKGGAQRFMPTAKVLVLTVLLAVLWPSILCFLGLCIRFAPSPTENAKAIAYGFIIVAIVALPIEFLRQVCRPHGLAEIHFRWPPNAVALLRRRLGRLMVVGFPWLFMSATFRELGIETKDGSLGRIAFVVFLGVVTVFVHRNLRPSSTIIRDFLADRPDGWLSKTKWFWYVLGLISPVLLIVLAVLGYYYAAWHFAARFMFTVWLLVGLVLLGALLLRWVLMVRRRLAIAHAMQRREAEQLASQQPVVEDVAQIDPTSLVPEVDLEKLNLQTRRLVYGSLAAACVLGVCLIWADILPAFHVLDNVSLWHTVVTVGQDTGMIDGGSVVRAVEQYEPVTLADLLIAVIGIVVTFVLARNFPGLLEFLLLQNLPMDSGLRHAITSVSRYVIVLIGIFFFFNTLGISWSKVQWLVAGVSVGLGFGLQEIFANFVSGLVILFERPVRPGDIITIGDATGKVSRIQIRATTITDWDRKELVVPNKEFITGRLLNWTLTDKTNRVTINVGVAYGSDPDRVREILLEIARAHPKVVESPAPIAICNNFGDNSLNFSLRIYLASMVGRLNVIHDMHAAIHNRFRQEGIEIAFPQLDLHMKSVGPMNVTSEGLVPQSFSADVVHTDETSSNVGAEPPPTPHDHPETDEER